MENISKAQKWNKENNDRWSIAKLTSGKFQAQVKKDSIEGDFCLVSVPEYKDKTGPVFSTIKDVKNYIAKQIENEIEWHIKMRGRWDFDLC